ncbi:MAG: hypothetical protein ACREQY_06515 [Candidatus Binatia bacterium]
MPSARAASTLVLTLLLAPPAASAATTLELEKLNRTYTDVAGELAPLVYEPLVIRLASPSQTVIVRGHRVVLTPLGGGRHRAAVEVELSGKGTLIADLELAGGQPQRMTDEVVLPLQKLVLQAVVSIERGSGGYRVVTHELPGAVRVDVRSRLVGDILEACAGLALLSLGALDCAPVTDALERPTLPLPGPGAELWLPDGDLTDEDRAQIDSLVVP